MKKCLKKSEHSVILEFLEKSNDSEWGVAYFLQTKPKTNQVHLLSDLRNIYKKLKCKPYPIPKINEILLELEGFKYAMSLDLNIRYYHIGLTNNVSNLYMIFLTWRDTITNV